MIQFRISSALLDQPIKSKMHVSIAVCPPLFPQSWRTNTVRGKFDFHRNPSASNLATLSLLNTLNSNPAKL